MYEDSDIQNLKKLIDKIKNYSTEKEKKISECPYNINLIEEFHINENAHTRILTRLLQYNKKGTPRNFPILKSFIGNIINKNNIFTKGIIDPKIAEQQNYIDCLITEEKKYAIIIENKIYDAVDQDCQIDRYVKSVEGTCENNDIFVIYLTKNGEKVVSEYAINDETKRILEWRNNNDKGRFISISYSIDILNWLQGLMQELKTENEPNIKCVIEQYINYIQNNLSTNNKFVEITTNLISNSMNLKNDFSHNAKAISDTKEKIDSYSKDMLTTLKEEIKKKFYNNDEITSSDASDASDALAALKTLDSFKENDANEAKACLQQYLINKYLKYKLNNKFELDDDALEINIGRNQANKKLDLNIYFYPTNKNKDIYIWIRFSAWGLIGMEWGVYSKTDNCKQLLFDDTLLDFKGTKDQHWIYGLSNGSDFGNWDNNETFVNKIIFSDNNNFIEYLKNKLEALFRHIEKTSFMPLPENKTD